MSDRPTPISDDPEAPFGFDDQGQPVAPYGLTQEGRPKRTPAGRPVGAATGSRRKSGGAPPKKSRPAAPKKPPAAKKPAAGPDYGRAVYELLQIPMVGLTMAGMAKPVLLADAVAVEQHLPPIAAAIGDLANDRPEIAAMLDRLMTAGPYTALIGAVVPLALQLAANHGLVKPGTLGTQPPAELVASMQQPTPEQVEAWARMAAEAEMANGAHPNAA